jgi:hypothetical protein
MQNISAPVPENSIMYSRQCVLTASPSEADGDRAVIGKSGDDMERSPMMHAAQLKSRR